MSESATAAPSAPSAASPAASAMNPGQPQGKATGPAQAADKGKGLPPQAQGKEAQPKAAAPSPEDEFEEVKIGSSSAKVPKAFAKTIKDLERGFQTKAQESAAARQILQLAEAAKEDPRAADLLFEKFGIDADKYSQSRLAKKLERELMSPEQRKAREDAEFRAQREEQDKRAKEQEEKTRLTQQEQKLNMELRQGLSQALEKSSIELNDPDSQEELSYYAARVVGVMAAADAQGLDWTWDQCVAKVERDRERADQSRVSKMDPEALEKWAGSEALDKWRAHNLKRVTEKASQKFSNPSPGSSPASKPKDGSKTMLSEAEYREWFANRSKQN